MREIVLDTETTGLDPGDGHRIIEVGCIELVNHLPSGKKFHSLFNPGRDVPRSATEVHGLKNEDLLDMPRFEEKALELMTFIKEDPIVIHNAQFDIAFLNAELARTELPLLQIGQTIDTLTMARKKFPGAPASLDALCRRFSIDNSERQTHSALLDADLLAQVYVELMGGRQPDLSLTSVQKQRAVGSSSKASQRHWPTHSATEEEIEKHTSLLSKLTDPIWTS